MAQPFAPYAGIEGAALTGGEGGDMLQKLLLGVLQGTAQIPQHVIQAAAQAAPPGLRREDVTDVPGSAQPVDPMVAQATQAAMLPMGTGAVAGVPVRSGDVAFGAGPIRAYHGSPHDFDKFDLSKIGTGEGAQAYGRGLYFAEREGVAKSYRDALAADPRDKITEMVQGWHGYRLPGEMLTHDVVRKGLERHHMAPLNDLAKNDKAVNDVVTYANGHSDDLRTVSPDAMAALRRLDAALPKPGGHMYEVNIKADPERFLDWDAPIKKQPFRIDEAVTDILRRSGATKDEANYYANNKTGQDVVRRISRPSHPIQRAPDSPFEASGAASFDEALGMVGGDKMRVRRVFTPDPAYTAQALRDAGVPGIKYLDQGSRSFGGGSRNYVVHDDRLIDILRKYGLAGLMPAGVGALASGAPQPSDGL